MNKKFTLSQAALAHSQKLSDMVQQAKKAGPGMHDAFMQQLQQMMLGEAVQPEQQQMASEDKQIAKGEAQLRPKV